MKKKQVCRKKAAALLAAACVAGNLPCGHVSVYAGETAAEIGDVHQEDETADQEAFGKETETVSGSAIQAVDAEADTQQEDSEGDIQDGWGIRSCRTKRKAGTGRIRTGRSIPAR